jgi:predicted deacylase
MVNPIGCSGTLVHGRAIVTAKHCLVDEAGKPSPPTSIGIGESVSGFAKTVAIATCYGHPTNDFAICTLAESVTEMPIVPVMAPCEMALLTKGAAVVEVGFGADKVTDATYGTKKWIAGLLADNATNTVDVIATAGNQDGEYYGDSGGPLYFRMPDGTWRLVGEDCCSDDIISGSSAPRLSTYTSVPFHVAWAEQETGLDLTPCHDARGWVGGEQCIGFPTDPGRTGGAWSSMCQGQTRLLAATCGGSIYDAGADGAGGTVIDAKVDTAETGDTSDAWTRDGSGVERVEPSLDSADSDDSDGAIDSSEAVDANRSTGGTGGAGSGGAGGVGVEAGNGGALGSGGRTAGTGGMATGGAAGSNAGGMPQAGGTTGLGGQPATAVDAGKDTARGSGPSSSGCSCRLENSGRPAHLSLLFALGSFVALRMRRARRRTTESTEDTEPERRQEGSGSGPFPSLCPLCSLWSIRPSWRSVLTCVAIVALAAACGNGNKGRATADAGVERGTGGAPGTGGTSTVPVDARSAGGSGGAGGTAGVDADLSPADVTPSDTGLDAPSDPPARLDAAATETGGCTLADTIPVDRLPSLSFASYHSTADITAYLSGVAAAVPEVVKAQTLGQSIRGRSIPYAIINATCQSTPPAVLLVGTHHGDEWSSTEAALANVDYLLRGGSDVRALLRSYAFYVLPVLNVDGHEASPPTRENADGVDINRDYAYPERPESSAFKEKETQLIKLLQDQVGFRAALTFHSGSTSVLWPWCYTATPAPDDARLSSVGAKTAQAMGFNTYAASYFDYPTQGEYIDYAYMKSKTLAFTVEVSLVKTPAVSTIPQIVATAWKGTLALLQALQSKHAPAVAVPSQMIVHAPRLGEERLE